MSAGGANGSSHGGNGSLNDDLYDGPSPFFASTEEPLADETAFVPQTQQITLQFDHYNPQSQYLLFCLSANADVSIRCSEQRVTGILSLANRTHKRVSTSAVQSPPPNIGIDTFEFWRPLRRPEGQNLAIECDPPLAAFSAHQLTNGTARPTTSPNAWVADPSDPQPTLRLSWEAPQTIARLVLSFDTDFDHPLESVLMGHPERVMPFCVQNYRIYDDQGQLVYEARENHQTRNEICLPSPIKTTELRIELDHPQKQIPAALFEVRCYSA